MNVLDRYAIAYKGLGAGKHEYEFVLDDLFFSVFDNPDILGGKGLAEVTLTKSETLIETDVRIRTTVRIVCDRCLDECTIPVDYHGGFKVRFTDAKDAKDDFDGEIMWLAHGDSILNVAAYIYESIVLAMPYIKVHPDRKDGTPGCESGTFENVKLITQEEFDRAEEGSRMQKMEDNPQWRKLAELRDKL